MLEKTFSTRDFVLSTRDAALYSVIFGIYSIYSLDGPFKIFVLIFIIWLGT